MKKIKGCLVVLLCCILVAGGCSYYFYNRYTPVPGFIADRLLAALKTHTRTRIAFKGMHMHPATGLVVISDLEARVAEPDRPFLTVPTITVTLGKGCDLIDVIRGNAPVEELEIINPVVDLTTALPERNPDLKIPEKLPPIPLKKLKISNLRIDASLGKVEIPVFRVEVKYLRELIEASINLGDNFSAILGHLDLRMPITGIGTSTANLELNCGDISRSDFLKTILKARGGELNAALSWKGNLLQRIKAPIDDPAGFFARELSGTIGIKALNLDALGSDYTVTGSFSGTEEPSWTGTMNINDATGTLEVKGTWKQDPGKPWRFGSVITGEKITLPASVIEKITESVPGLVSGCIDLSATIRGDAEHLESEGNMNTDCWSYLGLEAGDIKLSWKHVGPRVDGCFDLLSEYGNLGADLHYSSEAASEAEIIAEGRLDECDLRIVTQFIPEMHTEGRLFADFNLVMPLHDPLNTFYEAFVTVERPVSGFFSPEKAEVAVKGCGLRWETRDLKIQFKDGAIISSDGSITQDGSDCSLSFVDVDLSQLGVPSKAVSGKVSASGKLTGKLDRLKLNGDIRSQSLEVSGHKLAEVESPIALDMHSISLSRINAKFQDDGLLKGNFAYDFKNGNIEGFSAEFQRIPAEILSGYLPPGYDLNAGRFSGLIKSSVLRGKPAWNFNIIAADMSVFSEFIPKIALEGNYHDGKGVVEHLYLHAFDGTIDITGRFSSDGRFVGAVIGENITIEKIARSSEILPESSGKIDFQGEFQWSEAYKNGFLTVLARDLKVADRILGNMGGEIRIDSERLNVVKALFDNLGISLSGTLEWNNGFPYEATVGLSQTDLSFIPYSYGVGNFQSGDMPVEGSCLVKGKVSEKFPKLIDLRVEAAEIRQGMESLVTNKPARIIFRDGKFEIESLEIKYRHGVIGFSGNFDPSGETGVTLSGRDFSLLALGRLAAIPDWQVNGELSLDGEITGKYPDIALKSELKVSEFEYAGRFIPEIKLNCLLNREKCLINNLDVVFPGIRAVLQGEIPFSGYDKGRNMDLRVTIPEGPISDLPKFLPEIFTVASGSLAASMKFTGNPRTPVISGDLSFHADQLGFKGMHKPLTNVLLNVKTDDGIVNIDPIGFKAGRGSLLGSASVDFKNGPGSITANLKGEKLDLSYENLELAGFRAEVDLSGNLYNPIIRGKLHVPRGKAGISDKLFSKAKTTLNLPVQSLNYRLDIDVPRNFWLKNSFLNAEMRGKFGIEGDLETFHLDGGINCVQGWLYFQRRKFDIEAGEVKFGEVSGTLDPHFYVKSVAEIQNTQVFLTVQGMMSSFQSHIYSSPPLSEGDIYALLALGRNMEEAKKSDAMDLFENEVLQGLKNTYISGLIGSTISAALNLDEVFLGSVFDRTIGATRSLVRVGKYVGNNIFLAYEGTLSTEDKKSFIVEYRLPRGFFVSLELEQPEDRTRIGIKYDWKF